MPPANVIHERWVDRYDRTALPKVVHRLDMISEECYLSLLLGTPFIKPSIGSGMDIMAAINAVPLSHPSSRRVSQKLRESERIGVKIPDLFVSFLAGDPQVNSHYEHVKAESEAWISEFVPLT